jgi:hypothetical protein
VVRGGDSGAAWVLLDGVRELGFRYFRSAAGERTPVDDRPADATDVEIRLAASRGGASASVVTHVALRNRRAGF